MHNLATINGKVAMSYQGDTPWHNLGTRINSAANVAEAMEAASLNWQVGLQKTFYFDMLAGEYREVPMRKAVIRDVDSAVLGTVGNDFRPIQNDDAFGILNDACLEFGVTIESAGALGNGARPWMLAKLPKTIEPVPGDIINGYFMIVNAHDGSHSYDAIPTPIRVVCQNTLTAAMNGVGGEHTAKGRIIKLRHTTNVNDRLKEAQNLVKKLFHILQNTEETFAGLAAMRMTPVEVARWIEDLLPSTDPDGKISAQLDKRRKQIGMLVWGGKGAELAGADAEGATPWACFNAVCEYFDHVRPAEANTDKGRANANESAIFGWNAQIKALALQRARELVTVR